MTMIQINNAILHVFDQHSGVTVYSKERLDCTQKDVAEYLTKHIDKAFKDSSAIVDVQVLPDILPQSYHNTKTRILALWTIPLTFAEEYFLICHKQIIRHPSIVLYVILRKTTSAISELSSFQIKLALHIKLRKEKIWSETTLSSIIPYYQLPLKRYPLLHLLTQKHFVPDIWINAASLTGKMCRSYPTSF